MPSNNVTLYAIFRKIDTIPPVINNVSTSSTTNSITVVTTAIEEDGEIVKYEYKIDNEEYVEGDSNTYTFTGLTQNTSHKIKVRVTNRDNLQVESEEYNVSTKELNVPTFSEEETNNGITVTITYPEGEGLTYEYQKDNGEWTTATQNQTVEFTENGTLVARVSDGTNVITSSTYAVEMASLGSDLVESTGVVTSGDGLYADSYEENVYTYRGANPNNYVTFNGENWRIISVNTADNTIKIMRNAVLEDKAFDTSSNGRYNSSQYCNHSSNGCNIYGSSSTLYDINLSPITRLEREYNGTKYQLPTTEAELNTYLNGEYYNGLNVEAKNMIKEDAIYKVGVLYYDNTSMSQDMQQVSAAKWKGKVGLIDATEWIRASTNSSCTDVDAGYDTTNCKNNNWMFKSDYWWTLSPFSSGYSGYVWNLRGNGNINGGYAYLSNGVRPVVTLSPEVKIISGDGSESSPYKLEI